MCTGPIVDYYVCDQKIQYSMGDVIQGQRFACERICKYLFYRNLNMFYHILRIVFTSVAQLHAYCQEYISADSELRTLYINSHRHSVFQTS